MCLSKERDLWCLTKHGKYNFSEKLKVEMTNLA
jgi:hypothetical protein